VLDSGELPIFHRFSERDEVDPRRLAAELVRDGVESLTEINARAEDMAGRYTALIERVWGGADEYVQELVSEMTWAKRGGRLPLEKRRVPRIRQRELVRWRAGGGPHDLQQVLEETLADRSLFPQALEPPEGIRWSDDATLAWWAFYRPDRTIVVNAVLDSPGTPAEVISLLVFHELLHHEQGLRGETLGHGPRFRRREAQHPDRDAADVFLDEFDERFARD
jgi:hypothetical protein